MESDAYETFQYYKLENEIDDVFDESFERRAKHGATITQEKDDIFDEALERELEKDLCSVEKELFITIDQFPETDNSSSVDVKSTFYNDVDVLEPALIEESCNSVNSEPGECELLVITKPLKEEDDVDDVFDEEQEKWQTNYINCSNNLIKMEPVVDEHRDYGNNVQICLMNGIKRERYAEDNQYVQETLYKSVEHVDLDSKESSVEIVEKKIKVESDAKLQKPR